MRNLGTVLLIAGLGVGASGCATAAPVLRLYPQSAAVFWVSGRAVVARARAGIRTAASFDGQEGPVIRFRVEIENDTSAQFDIDPKDVQFITCAGSDCSENQSIPDPEQELLALDERRANAVAAAENAESSATGLSFLAAIGNVASVANPRARDAAQSASSTALMAQGEAAGAQENVTQIDSARLTWSTALRRTTLLPGHGVGGFVYLPAVPAADLIWLDVAAGARHFWYPFRQTVIAPSAGASAKESNESWR